MLPVPWVEKRCIVNSTLFLFYYCYDHQNHYCNYNNNANRETSCAPGEINMPGGWEGECDWICKCQSYRTEITYVVTSVVILVTSMLECNDVIIKNLTVAEKICVTVVMCLGSFLWYHHN